MVNVMVMDDSKMVRKMISAMLERDPDIDYRIFEAENGIEGLSIATCESLDCITADITMPDMDGVEFLQQMKEKNIQVPTIMMTAITCSDVKDECTNLGAFGYLNKPPKPAELCEAVHLALKYKGVKVG